MEKIDLSKNKENLNPKNEINENEAKKQFEEIFNGMIGRYSKVGVIEGAKYIDYIGAMQELDFLGSDLEKLDVINFTATSAMESSLGYERGSGYEIHRFYMDRSARILGVFLHDVLSKMNEKRQGLLNKEIFFINPNNILNINQKIAKEEKDKIETKIAETLLSGEKGKKVINIIVDEFIASGDGINDVRAYFDKICREYKTSETNQVLNTTEGFYTAGHSPKSYMYRTGTEEPSWCRESSVSGVIEQKVNGKEIIIPVTDEDDRINVEKVRKSLRRASVFVANMVKNGLENSPKSEEELMYSIISFEEKRALGNEIRDLFNNLINQDIESGRISLNGIEKQAKHMRNNQLLDKIPEIRINLDRMGGMKDSSFADKEFIALYESIQSTLEPYV